MKKLTIPQYNFYKHKYGDELLIDVVRLDFIKKYMVEHPAHTLTYFDITLITKGEGVFCVNGTEMLFREVFPLFVVSNRLVFSIFAFINL
ncbi:hypothetical protein [Parabacteroides chinchillae]|uniref:hypothetical protein n=1 Tax=Parabacteroides chinchillae TaxID=871327 RepID=UPI001F3A2750|nr:hypothetical protein [Parabacteroides chinchillae]